MFPYFNILAHAQPHTVPVPLLRQQAGTPSSSSATALRISHLPSLLWTMVCSFAKWEAAELLFPLTWAHTYVFALPPLATRRLLGTPHLSGLHALPSPPSSEPRPVKGSSVRRWAGPPAWNHTGSSCPERALAQRTGLLCSSPSPPPRPRATLRPRVCGGQGRSHSLLRATAYPGTARPGKECHDLATGVCVCVCVCARVHTGVCVHVCVCVHTHTWVCTRLRAAGVCVCGGCL